MGQQRRTTRRPAVAAVAAALVLLPACSDGASPGRLTVDRAAAAGSESPAAAAPPASAAPSPSDPPDSPETLTTYQPSPAPTTAPPAETPTPAGPSLPPGEFLLPNWPGNALPAVLWPDLTISGDAATHCVWFAFSDGVRHSVLWPHGYRARFDPVRIYDAQDREVWREGQVKDSGGFNTAPWDRVPPACRVGDGEYWIGGSVPNS
jgi:hypothetical protein